MTRVLTFDGSKAAQRFQLLRLAILAAGDGKGERTRETIRKEARLLDALDLVSDPDPAKPDERLARLDAEAVVAQEDFDLLCRYADTTPWLPRVARDAVDLQDWLSASERRD